MALRLVEIIVPDSVIEKSRKLMEQHEVVSQWEDKISNQLVLLRCLVRSENTEKLTESLSKQFSHEEHFRIILLPVEATLPPKLPQDCILWFYHRQVCNFKRWPVC